MGEWEASAKAIGAITLFVGDLDATRAYYRDVFSLAVHYEDANSVVFRFGDTLLNLLRIDAAGDLLAPATAAADGIRSQFTLAVDDVDAVCRELARRGVTLLNGPMDRWWGVRTASFQDPDGYVWEIAQDLHSP